uniref:Prominin-1 n=1 Tax=Macrostomum lignano TaxID=282301 RepID=A0A1I8G507_9PLAT
LSGAAAELDAVPQRARNASAKVVGATLSKLNPTVQASVSAMKVALLDKSDLNNQLGKAKSALASLTKARTLSKRLNQSTWSEVASSWSQLNNTLASLRDALKSISDCPAAAEADCRWLQSKLDWLRVSEPAPSRDSKCNLTLPAELTNSNWDSLESLLNNQPAGLVQTAMDALDRDLKAAKSDLNSSANLSQIWSAAESVAANASAYLRQVANSVNAMIINPTNNAEQSVAAVLTAFDLYRYYLCIGLACLALLIVAFYYLGLAFGFCGEPPYEDSRCCNKGVGANLLLTGTGFAFIFGWLIMIFVMAFFVSGAVMEVCRHLTGRAGAPGYAAMDSAAEELLSGSSGSLSRYTGRRLFSGLFGDCADAAAAGKPASFASVLNLSELVQPTYLKRRSGQLIDKVASELQAKWPQIANNSFADPNSLLKRLAPLRAAVDQAGGPAGLAAATCAAALTQGPLSYGLDAERLVDSVKQMSKTLAADAASSPAVNSRWSSLADSLPADIHAAVASIADKRNASSGLSDALANANKSGRNVTYQLKDAAARAINDSAVLNASLLVARQNLKAGVDSLIRGALADVLNTAADCAALGANLRQAVRAPCVQLLQPLNGYWAGLGLCLLWPAAGPAAGLQAGQLAPSKIVSFCSDSRYSSQGKPKRRKTSGSRDKSRNSQQHSGIPGASSSAAAAGVSNRQSQRYSQLPSYAQEAYDY